jgi:hypothetical protein
LRSWGHPGDCHQTVPRPGGRPALKAAAVPLRHNGGQGALGRYCDRARSPIAGGDPVSRGAGDRKSNFSWLPAHLLPMLPNEGTEKLVSSRLLRQVIRKT